MKISFGNMIVELNIFNINKQPLDYDEVYHVCLLEEITKETISEFSLEDLEVECFIQDGDDLDLDRLFGQAGVLYEPNIEDTEMESFARSRDDLDFGRLLEQVGTMRKPSIEDPKVEFFAQYGGDMDLDRLLELAEIVREPDMENPVLECFTHFGYDLGLDELVEQAEADLDPILKMQPECGEITEISFPTPYSSAVEPLKLIFESN